MYKEIAEKIKDIFPEERDSRKLSVALNVSSYLLLIDNDFEKFSQKVYDISNISLDSKTPLSIETTVEFLYALYDKSFNILDRKAEEIYEQIAELYRANLKV